MVILLGVLNGYSYGYIKETVICKMMTWYYLEDFESAQEAVSLHIESINFLSLS